MEDQFKECLWKNFAAAIDMLSDIVAMCPDTIWEKKDRFFYVAYHTTIFLDYYLTYPVRTFDPLLPFSITDEHELPPEAIDDVIPNRLYSKEDLIVFIRLARNKCPHLCGPQADQDLLVRWIEKSEVGLHGLCPTLVEHYSILEILFYNLRHVQHHVAQLNTMLRSRADVAAEWISHAE